MPIKKVEESFETCVRLGPINIFSPALQMLKQLLEEYEFVED